MRILPLTLHKEWFDAIASGVKHEEYRENKTFWQQRLINKSYDEIHFTNGYGRDKPFMRVECLGIQLDRRHNRFVIKLGKILEVSNYQQ